MSDVLFAYTKDGAEVVISEGIGKGQWGAFRRKPRSGSLQRIKSIPMEPTLCAAIAAAARYGAKHGWGGRTGDEKDRFDDGREPDTTRGGPCRGGLHRRDPEDRDEYEDEARALEFEQTRGDVTRRDP
jgi:hypothetical protein